MNVVFTASSLRHTHTHTQSHSQLTPPLPLDKTKQWHSEAFDALSLSPSPPKQISVILWSVWCSLSPSLSTPPSLLSVCCLGSQIPQEELAVWLGSSFYYQTTSGPICTSVLLKTRHYREKNNMVLRTHICTGVSFEKRHYREKRVASPSPHVSQTQ
jgi:hypothetical protein